MGIGTGEVPRASGTAGEGHVRGGQGEREGDLKLRVCCGKEDLIVVLIKSSQHRDVPESLLDNVAT